MHQTNPRLNDLGFFSDVKVTPVSWLGRRQDARGQHVRRGTEKANGELSLGGGYSTTDRVCSARRACASDNLLGTGIDAGINGTIAQRDQSQVDLSVTDPYFLDRNLVAGADIFYLNNNNQYVSDYERDALRHFAAPGLQLTTNTSARPGPIR